MSLYLNTTGRASLGIGICDRCARKFPLVELYHDPNSPGLVVCRNDIDQFDPWRLPARTPENIILRFVRPDVSIAIYELSVEPAAGDFTYALLLENNSIYTLEDGVTPLEIEH